MQDPTLQAAALIRRRIASLGLAVAAGEAQHALGEEQAVQVLDALVNALERHDVVLLVDQLRASDGIHTLAAARTVLVRELPTSLVAPVRAYLDAAGEDFVTDRTSGRAPLPHPPEAAELLALYLEALLEGDRHAASAMILTAVDQGMRVRDVYQQVFQPALHEVGRLWQRNLVNVAQEHFITAATQLIMSQLYPRIFSTQRCGRRFVGTCVSGELHEVGVRMVADFFEMAGWDTYYLGANVPSSDVVQAVKARHADVLGVSATLTAHALQAAELIESVRSDEACRSIRTVVGGQAFEVERDAWRRTGADGHAATAEAAVRLASAWLEPA